jgi:lipopolysaccharide assembly outer membrane protein LptD (OstA)
MWRLSVNYALSSQRAKNKPISSEYGTEQELKDIEQNPEKYLDWDNPWQLNIGYTFEYRPRIYYEYFEAEKEIIQSLRLSGNVNLTPKWKISFNTGYDFTQQKVTLTELNITRDLHCWELNMQWTPFGQFKSYIMTLRVKAAVLQDLKLTKRADWKDSY